MSRATLPDADGLPADTQPLVRRQALALSNVRWRGDLLRLVGPGGAADACATVRATAHATAGDRL